MSIDDEDREYGRFIAAACGRYRQLNGEERFVFWSSIWVVVVVSFAAGHLYADSVLSSELRDVDRVERGDVFDELADRSYDRLLALDERDVECLEVMGREDSGCYIVVREVPPRTWLFTNKTHAEFVRDILMEGDQ